MAILMRQGLYDDFDASRMLPGEWAVAVDGDTEKQVVWMCFAPGVTKRMGTYEDFKQQIADATGEIKEEYISEFETILEQIETLAAQTDTNTNTVLQIKTDFTDTYLPQIKQAVSDSEAAEKTATQRASDSEEYAMLSQSYAVGTGGARENEAVDSSKYYYEQVKRISGGLSGALTPMGTIVFADLQNMTKQPGYMYNISDAFVTDDTFNEGAGFPYPEGTNVYYTADGYWDCLAGTVTPEGIGALAVDGDSKNNTVSFTSGDMTETEESPLTWADVELLKTGERQSSLFEKISTMFRNVRYLFKMLGSTDISGIGDGTCTGALSTLNTDLNNIFYSGQPASVTGSYGSYVNVKTWSIVRGTMAILFFSGQVTGTIDINLSAFGITKRNISLLVPEGCILASAEGINGGTLYVKCYPHETSLQLRSSIDNDNYTVMIPIILE